MIKRFKSNKQGNCIGFEIIKSKNRYRYDAEDYRLFLHNISSAPSMAYDPEYYDFYIDLLRKETQYSSLLEINRENSQHRFIYPFHKMNALLLGYGQEKKTVEIDIRDNNLISEPWKHSSYSSILNRLKHTKFEYDASNHKATYYHGLNVTCVKNGFHSLGAAVYLGNGRIQADYYDVEKIYEKVKANDDLAFSYDEERILKDFDEQGVTLPQWLKTELKMRFYGTDYRLMLIYELSKRKYLRAKNEPQRNF